MQNTIPVKSIRDRIQLTSLGLGGAQFGNLFRQITDEECSRAVDAAWESGIRYFDVAPHYGLGLAEIRLGKALARYPREQYVVSSKVGRLLIPSPENESSTDSEGFVVPAAFKRIFDYSRDGILKSYESSLERLGLDYIDILYLHDPDNYWDSASTSGVQTLIELRDQGAVKAIGAGMNQHEMLTKFVRETDIDLVMLAGRFTLLEQGALEDLLPLCVERNVGVVNVGVYNSGLLSKNRAEVGTHLDYVTAPIETIEHVNSIAEICEKFGVSLPEVALKYVELHPAVISIVLGARSRTQVLENVLRHQKEVPAALWEELSRRKLIADPSTFVQRAQTSCNLADVPSDHELRKS